MSVHRSQRAGQVMLNKEKNEENKVFVETLSYGSSIEVYLNCDYCGKEIYKSFKLIKKQNEIVNKDTCKDCKFIKRADICEAKHGVRSHSQLKDVKDKIKKTNIKKYGCETPLNNNKKVKEKADKTRLEKYGSENYTQTYDFKEKYKNTCIEKYGVDNVSKVKKIRDKVKQTNLQKYGKEEFLASEQGREKVKEGMIEKYGVENPFQIPEVIQKLSKNHHMKDKEHAKEVHEKGVQTKIETGQIKIYDGKTIPELAIERGFSRSRFSVLVNKYGFEECMKMTPYESTLETRFASWLDSQNISYKKNVRLENTRPDFVINDNIVVELDGLYWHSELCQRDDNYHFNKKETYNKLGYKSFFFREDELRDKEEIVHSIILNALNKSQKIYARKTKIIELSNLESKDFLNKNHLMGNGKGRTFALTYNDTPISLIRINRVKDKSYDISRFCNKLGYSVIGGFSKLLKHVEKELDMDELTTFIDRRYGVGEYLTDFGFIPTTCYKSFKWTNGEGSYNRMLFKGQIGYEKELVKLWDCGQKKFKKFYLDVKRSIII